MRWVYNRVNELMNRVAARSTAAVSAWRLFPIIYGITIHLNHREALELMLLTHFRRQRAAESYRKIG